MGVPCIDAEVCVLSEESGHIDVGLVWTLRAIACCLIHALNRVSKAAHRRVEVDRVEGVIFVEGRNKLLSKSIIR